MDTQLIAFLMFLTLTYLLFRRPTSMAPKRYPTELDFRIGHSVLAQRELLKETAATAASTHSATPTAVYKQPNMGK
jgi:hypothetical protein